MSTGELLVVRVPGREVAMKSIAKHEKEADTLAPQRFAVLMDTPRAPRQEYLRHALLSFSLAISLTFCFSRSL